MIEEFTNLYIKEKGHVLKPRLGLVNPEFDRTFTPSVGAVHVDRFLKSEDVREPKRFSIIEFAYRNFDARKVEASSTTLSLFEMCSAFSFNDMGVKDYVDLCWEFLVNRLSLPKNKIYVTIWSGGNIQGFDFKSNTESHDAWLAAGIDKHNLILTRSRDCFLFPRLHEYSNVIDIIGPRDEVYFLLNDGSLLEIATLQYVINEVARHPKSMELLPAKTKSFVATAYGIERILMILENSPTIFDTSKLKTIKNMILDQMHNKQEQKVYESHLRVFIDAIRALVYILGEDVNRMTTRQKELVSSVFNQVIRASEDLGLSVTVDFYISIIDKIVEDNRKNYPHLLSNKEKVVGWLKWKYAQELDL